jgi:transposase
MGVGTPRRSSPAFGSRGWSPPGVFDGPIDAASFTAWVEQVLAPTLRPGDTVILDSLSCHQSPAVRSAIEAVGRTWLLPKYSPDVNLIALCFAKLKAILRAARCRTFEAIWRTIGQCIPRLIAPECQHYFRHCGYSGTTVRS